MNFRQVTICAAAALLAAAAGCRAHAPACSHPFEQPQVARPAIPSNAVSVADCGGSGGGETGSGSTADAIVGGDEFAAALLAALEKLSADETAQTVLRLYDGDGVRYSGADPQAVDFAQYLLGNTEGVYQLTSE